MRLSVFLILIILIPGITRAQWTKLESGTTRNLNSVYLPMGSAVVVGDSGTILKRSDAQHWVPKVSGTTNNLYSVSFGNYTDGYAVGAHGTILRTMSAGQSWTVRDPGVQDNLYSAFSYGSYYGWVVGSAGTILKTTDGGETWIKQVSGLQETDNLYSVCFTS